ncbi:MAG: hypothetical protein FWD06_09690 [Oscillospiraceae bacterium]|nr:hypothetical protein [Oscillospiraceae bacterium]
MINFTKEQFDEILADCTDEALNEWLDTCTNEELAVLVCVARTMRQRRDS